MERVLFNSVNFVHSVKTLILLAKAQRMIKATLLRQNLQNEQNGIAPSISWRGACPLRNEKKCHRIPGPADRHPLNANQSALQGATPFLNQHHFTRVRVAGLCL